MNKELATCKHERKRSMTWPDGGTSELCETCLRTRHIDDVYTTEWQNHGYKTPEGWYKEALVLQQVTDTMLERARKSRKGT